MRPIFKSFSIIVNNVFKVNKPIFRALNQDHSVQITHETLTGRILLYLNSAREKLDNSLKNAVENVSLSQLQQNARKLSRYNTEELLKFSHSLTRQSVGQRRDVAPLLRELDVECYQRVSEFQHSDIFTLLNIYMTVAPNRITEFKFYKQSVKVLFESLKQLSKNDLLQLIFYIGLRKKCTEAQNMLRHCLRSLDANFINNLTLEELCIICNSTFKTSTKMINPILLGRIRDFMNENLLIMKDPAMFITLIKTLRHNRFQDDNLLTTLSNVIFFNKTYSLYTFSAICHILALYADYFYYDSNLLNLFTKQCLDQLEKSNFTSPKLHLTAQLRAKDITRFIWVLGMYSEMKLVNQCDVKNVIIPKLIERLEAREIDSLTDIMLYLWMMNYRPYELVPYVRKDAAKTGPKPHSNLRLNLLLHAISIEDPDFFKQLPFKLVNIPSNVISTYQLRNRPVLEKVFNTLGNLREKSGLSRFELTQEIPHLNIVGITGYKNHSKAIYIEVLDNYNSLRNLEEDVPVGLMALKLRLLARYEEGLLTVSQKDIEDLTEAKLASFLLDEIKLIC